MTARSATHSLLSTALVALLLPAVSNATTITREFTAAWGDPARSGHGLGLEIIGYGADKRALAYWFTYDTDGKQLWMYGVGPVVGDRVAMTVFKTRGGSFTGNFDPARVEQQAWGQLEISFSDCNRGQLRYTPNDPASTPGVMPLERVTQLFNSSCSGGVSDDFQNGSLGAEQIVFLRNVGPYGAAQAKAKFETRADRTEFSVELEDLPVGSYALRVDNIARGTITVRALANGTEGEIEFRSPVEPGKVLLDFDPRNASIEVRDASGRLFEGQFAAASTPPSPPVGGGAVPTGSGRYELVVEPSGSDGPELHAKLEQRSDRVDFSVELEDVPVGSYALRVGGVERGTVNVVSAIGGTEGEIEYRDPVEPGKLLLNFDPRGMTIEATGPGGTRLNGVLPSTPTGAIGGGGDDDDDDCDDGSNGDDCDNDDGGGTPPGSSVVSTRLSSTGIDSNANGEASYERSANETEFEVEVEDLDDGQYVLRVGGVQRAVILVADEEGEVKFNNPARPGRLMLDFDPRGQDISIERDGRAYLRGRL